jgi:hypothetical protein
MFAIILAAFLADATPPALTAAPSVGPLREIVYKYSLNSTGTTTAQSYEQGTDTSTSVGGYNGSMTIDILQVDPSNGYLKAHVKDSTNALNYRAPNEADIIIHPDGELIVTAGKVDEDMATIVPYLGTKYFGDNELQQGNQWASYSTSDGIDYKTTTTVSGVSGDVATISLETKAEKGVINGAFEIEGKIGYEAAKLVPVSLDVIMTRTGSDVASGGGSGFADEGTHMVHYHFVRLSDTLDRPAGQ